jgi:hypothetical protein
MSNAALQLHAAHRFRLRGDGGRSRRMSEQRSNGDRPLLWHGIERKGHAAVGHSRPGKFRQTPCHRVVSRRGPFSASIIPGSLVSGLVTESMQNRQLCCMRRDRATTGKPDEVCSPLPPLQRTPMTTPSAWLREVMDCASLHKRSPSACGSTQRSQKPGSLRRPTPAMARAHRINSKTVSKRFRLMALERIRGLRGDKPSRQDDFVTVQIVNKSTATHRTPSIGSNACRLND